MSNEYKYLASHEWVQPSQTGRVKLGISDHAQAQLGDIVYVELPELDSQINKGDQFGVVESVKAASDLFSPVSGKVVAVNTELEDTPELVNDEPLTKGWICELELTNSQELDDLLNEGDYKNTLNED